MYKAFILLLVGVVFSCKEISFKEPQPKGKRALSEMPRELRGNYLFADEDGNQDTLFVTTGGYYIPSDSTRGSLGDSLVLKKYKGFYFLNFNDDEDSVWLLRVVKVEKNGDLSYMYMHSGEASFNQFLLELNKEIKIDSSEVNGEKLYQIDPAPRQLLDLIKKGYFKKEIKFIKLN
jgi:hypothetical protein